ncbi:MAG: peptide/nickel transport system permease protein [Fusobacteriaceae bacterium]|jgi:peptide/nickel transport system permease protein|nr:binding-protein-dependent transport system inner rane component [Fusobacteriales bacterium]MDN5303365.1 peptide/nickel transport system permease protein [Fusobacteriaceae bacterium]
MLNYIIKRLGMLIIILFASSLIIFGIMKAAPGDPATILLGENATEQSIIEVNEKYGLDKPLYVQYTKMMYNFFNGELKSIYYKDNVINIVLKRLPATIELGIFAIFLAVLISVPVGIISAVKRNSIFDYFSMGVALFGVSIPVFFTGILLMYLFSVKFGLLPASGYNGHIWTVQGFKHFILPGISLSLVLMSSTTRLTRSAMLDVIHQDYMRTAKAKGVNKFKIIFIHGLRNAMIPIITNIGNQIASIFAGAVLTETVFSWPGVGRLAVDAVFRRDEPLVFGAVIMLTGIYVIVNLLVDIIYVFIDPQISYD